MITQEEIAKQLGISRTTVARAINGNASIKEETRQKVMELVEKYNYEKNYIGSLLAVKKTKKIYCLVVKSKNEYYTNQILKGLDEVEKEFSVYNFSLEKIITDINDEEAQIKELKNILKKEDIDGLIITPLAKEKINKILKPYLNKIEIVSLGIRLSDKIHHVGPDHFIQGQISAGIMNSMLRKDEKLLVIDNGDDKISSKLYIEGFLSKIKESEINLVGPIECNGIEESIKYIKEILLKENIMGIYINRYAQEIFESLPAEILKDKKIITNGISRSIKDLIEKKVITATVMEEISIEGYLAGKCIFDKLYKNEKSILWEVSKSHIIFLENLEIWKEK